jgi:hypothetical protein
LDDAAFFFARACRFDGFLRLRLGHDTNDLRATARFQCCAEFGIGHLHRFGVVFGPLASALLLAGTTCGGVLRLVQAPSQFYGFAGAGAVPKTNGAL